MQRSILNLTLINRINDVQNPTPSFFCALLNFLTGISKKTNMCASSRLNGRLSVDSSPNELWLRSRTTDILSCGKRSRDWRMTWTWWSTSHRDFGGVDSSKRLPVRPQWHDHEWSLHLAHWRIFSSSKPRGCSPSGYLWRVTFDPDRALSDPAWHHSLLSWTCFQPRHRAALGDARCLCRTTAWGCTCSSHLRLVDDRSVG
jgi:hypothetical protein